jgi:hypothetical protein
MTTELCGDVVLGLDVELGLDVVLGLDVEPLRLVASEPPEHADNTAAKIASRTSRTTNTYCPFRAGRARPRAAQNNASARSGTGRRTGDLCVEDHERVCADRARLTAVV